MKAERSDRRNVSQRENNFFLHPRISWGRTIPGREERSRGPPHPAFNIRARGGVKSQVLIPPLPRWEEGAAPRRAEAVESERAQTPSCFRRLLAGEAEPRGLFAFITDSVAPPPGVEDQDRQRGWFFLSCHVEMLLWSYSSLIKVTISQQGNCPSGN